MIERGKFWLRKHKNEKAKEQKGDNVTSNSEDFDTRRHRSIKIQSMEN